MIASNVSGAGRGEFPGIGDDFSTVTAKIPALHPLTDLPKSPKTPFWNRFQSSFVRGR